VRENRRCGHRHRRPTSLTDTGIHGRGPGLRDRAAG
jgi:hypothetical protein